MSNEEWAKWFQKMNNQGIIWNEDTKQFIQGVVTAQAEAINEMLDGIPVKEEE